MVRQAQLSARHHATPRVPVTAPRNAAGLGRCLCLLVEQLLSLGGDMAPLGEGRYSMKPIN